MAASLKKLTKKVSFKNRAVDDQRQRLLTEFDHHHHHHHEHESNCGTRASTPNGYFAMYVGEERKRFVVRTSFLTHPLLKMLLHKAYEEFGFDQKGGLVIPCSVSAFEEVLNALECSGADNNGGGVSTSVNLLRSLFRY